MKEELKGKWEVMKDGSKFWIVDESKPVAKVTNLSNAQLVAAAPEMLAALQQCVAGMKILSTSNPEHKGLKIDIRQAQEAINKALGL